MLWLEVGASREDGVFGAHPAEILKVPTIERGMRSILDALKAIGPKSVEIRVPMSPLPASLCGHGPGRRGSPPKPCWSRPGRSAYRAHHSPARARLR